MCPSNPWLMTMARKGEDMEIYEYGKAGEAEEKKINSGSYPADALFICLEDAVEEERAAILTRDQEKMEKIQARLTGLLDDMSALLKNPPPGESLSAFNAQSVLRRLRLFREENGKLLERALQETGQEVKSAVRGQGTLRAYFHGSEGEALFLEKNC